MLLAVAALAVPGWRGEGPGTIAEAADRDAGAPGFPGPGRVAWRAWGDEALAEAGRRDLPLFVHIGQPSCHWCSVMAAGAFLDDEVIARLQRDFVPVYLDSDERPDVAAVYLKAMELFARAAGLPANLVLTPEALPFGATLFLPTRSASPSRPGLVDFLAEARTAWREDPEAVGEQGIEATASLRVEAERHTAGTVPEPAVALAMTTGFLASGFDEENGGFGTGAKFPRPVVLDLLLRSVRRTADEGARHMVERTLEAMSMAPVRDQLGGGFHRHSRDAAWRRPELDKTLEDNAQLAVVYMDAARVLGRPDFAHVAAGILRDLDENFSVAGGGFCAALAATSLEPGGSPRSMGAYYTWSGTELRAALDPGLRTVVDRHFGVGGLGEDDERRVLLSVAAPPEAVAEALGVPVSAVERDLETARSALLARRSQRAAPLRDDRVVAAWNGLAISAFAKASRGLRETRYRARAIRAAEFVLAHLLVGDRLARLHDGTQARGEAVVDDYALLAGGLLDLFEVDPDLRWLDAARRLVETAVTRFWDEERAAFRLAASPPSPGLPRLWPSADDTRLSGNAAMAAVLLRLAPLVGDPQSKARAARLLAGFGESLATRPIEVPGLVAALERYGDIAREAAVLVPGDAGSAGRFEAELAARYLPNDTVIFGTAERLAALSKDLPWLVPLDLGRSRVSAWICREGACGIATGDPARFGESLDRGFPLRGGG